MSRLDEAEARARARLRAAIAALPEPPERVVLGVSGGADSLALAVVAAFVADRDPVRVEVLVVDHGLQPDSADVAADAVATVRALGLPARAARVHVDGAGGPEAAARTARRRALLQAAGPSGVVALGHTLDDQAESVLLGLGRGSGARSIAGMRESDGRWLRPLLTLRRTDTERICADHGLEPWSDPHNADPTFRRVRVRHEVLPLLEDVLGGGVVEALARTADQLQADNGLLDAAADRSITDDVAALEALPRPVRTRVLRRLALAAGARPGELTAVHVAALDRLVTEWRGQARVELPGHVSCRRVDGRLVFGSDPGPREDS